MAARGIAENVTQAAGGIGEVNKNVAQSSMATSEIAKVSQKSIEMKSSSRQVNLSTGELGRLAEGLKAMSSRFNVQGRQPVHY